MNDDISDLSPKERKLYIDIKHVIRKIYKQHKQYTIRHLTGMIQRVVYYHDKEIEICQKKYNNKTLRDSEYYQKATREEIRRIRAKIRCVPSL